MNKLWPAEVCILLRLAENFREATSDTLAVKTFLTTQSKMSFIDHVLDILAFVYNSTVSFRYTEGPVEITTYKKH